MMRSAALLLATSVAVVAASPAAAQLAPGYSGFSTAPTEATNAEYWDMMERMGGCLARQKHDNAVAFVSTIIDTDEEASAHGELFDRKLNNCMGQFVSAVFVRAHVRGVVAEGLVEDLDEATFERLIATPPAPPAQITTLHELASCYVAAHPAEALGLLKKTKLQTRGELAYIQQIAPNLQPCLPEGLEIDLDPIDIRLAIAEALYRAATGLPRRRSRDVTNA